MAAGKIINQNSIRPPHERGRAYDGQMLDITGAQDVEVSISRSPSGLVIHINSDGICVFRMCCIKGSVNYEDHRYESE